MIRLAALLFSESAERQSTGTSGSHQHSAGSFGEPASLDIMNSFERRSSSMSCSHSTKVFHFRPTWATPKWVHIHG
jgi:hypothetical protein